MADPYFEKVGSSPESIIFLRGNQVGDSIEFQFNDNVYYTIGGVSVVDKMGTPRKRFEFTTGDMTKAQRDDFIDFLENTSEGRKETFTYYNRDGDDFIVRLVEGSVRFTTNGPLYWVASVTLEEVLS